MHLPYWPDIYAAPNAMHKSLFWTFLDTLHCFRNMGGSEVKKLFQVKYLKERNAYKCNTHNSLFFSQDWETYRTVRWVFYALSTEVRVVLFQPSFRCRVLVVVSFRYLKYCFVPSSEEIFLITRKQQWNDSGKVRPWLPWTTVNKLIPWYDKYFILRENFM